MQPPSTRFTMRRMMAGISLAAVALAITRHTFLRWGTEGLTNLAYWVFLAAAVIPFSRKGRWAMFWAGFGGFGMLYLSCTTFGFLSLPFRLPTSLLLDFIHDRLPASFPVPPIDFQRAGHALFAILFGILVGSILATQVPAGAQREKIPFRARARANFPTFFAAWDRLWSGRV